MLYLSLVWYLFGAHLYSTSVAGAGKDISRRWLRTYMAVYTACSIVIGPICWLWRNPRMLVSLYMAPSWAGMELALMLQRLICWCDRNADGDQEAVKHPMLWP